MAYAVPSVDNCLQNGRVCQKYVALTEANVAGYVAYIRAQQVRI